MQDINYPLQKAYTLALSGITYEGVSVPAYYGQIPENLEPENYIIFSPVTNVDTGTKTTFDTDSLMNVTIYTHTHKYNTGKACHTITGIVLERIYTKPSSLVVPGFQVLNTILDGDTTSDFSVEGVKVIVDRRLTFRHSIYQQ